MWIFIILSTILLLSWFVWDCKRYAKYPPGPLRFPIVGNLFQIARISKNPGIAFQTLSKKYGDLLFVRIGGANTIVCNSLETLKYLRIHELCQNRAQHMAPGIWERQFRQNIGIAFANGMDQQVLKRFTIRTLRDFGFGKATSTEMAIEEELQKFITHLNFLSKRDPSRIVDTVGLFDMTVLNIVWKLVTGQSYDLNDEKMQKLLNLGRDVFLSINVGMDLCIAFPYLFHLFPNKMGKSEIRIKTEKLADFLKETIATQRQVGNYKTNPTSYLDVFLCKIDEQKCSGETAFNDEQLVMCLIDLFQAASDTTSNTLNFSLLYMTIHSEIQKKVQKEMEENLQETETLISYSMRKRLPYTYAALLECTRYSTIAPTTGANYAADSFYYKGYLIEKGVYIVPNTHAVHFSKEIWGDPENFRPERFLTKDGTIDNEMTSNLIHFGFGSRSCLGAPVAEKSLFPYFASLLRNFQVLRSSKDDKLSIIPNIGFVLIPKPYKVKLIPRSVQTFQSQNQINVSHLDTQCNLSQTKSSIGL